MSKVSVRIEDESFAHSPGLTVHHVPEYIEWVRGTAGDTETVFFTDRRVGVANQVQAKRKVALLIEPPQIYGTGYKVVRDRPDDFNYVLTYDEQFTLPGDTACKVLYYPIGGCWIPKEDRHPWPKTKMCSIVASGKRLTPDHLLRHEAIEMLRGRIDVFGHGYKPVAVKTEALAPYRFSVVMENAVIDTLFTEKLIDCFLTRTIPIYYGTRNISRFFDMTGVIQFSSLAELESIVSRLRIDDYDHRLGAVEENWRCAHHYLTAEDWLFRTYHFLFTS